MKHYEISWSFLKQITETFLKHFTEKNLKFPIKCFMACHGIDS